MQKAVADAGRSYIPLHQNIFPTLTTRCPSAARTHQHSVSALLADPLIFRLMAECNHVFVIQQHCENHLLLHLSCDLLESPEVLHGPIHARRMRLDIELNRLGLVVQAHIGNLQRD